MKSRRRKRSKRRSTRKEKALCKSEVRHGHVAVIKKLDLLKNSNKKKNPKMYEKDQLYVQDLYSYVLPPSQDSL